MRWSRPVWWATYDATVSAIRDGYDRARPVVRVVIALAITSALAAQLQLAEARGNINVGNFFSFFTVESNIAAALVLIALEFSPGTALNDLARRTRPAVTLYMSMTGVIYIFSLAPSAADVGLTARWVDVVVHLVCPVAVVLDWFLAPPDDAPEYKEIRTWLVVPVLYVAYSLIRGAIVDWYPYPFLDSRLDGGGGAVTSSVAVLAVCVLAFAVAFVKLTPRPGNDRATPLTA